MMLRRTLIIALSALLAALLVGVVGAILLLHEPPHAVWALARYLILSGGLALLIGSIGVQLGMRFLPRLSLKVGLGYVVGSVAAMLTVLYTPLLMFKEQSDLHLLVLLLASFLIISLGLATVIGLSASRQVRAVADAARELEAGRFGTRVAVPSTDELADLAEAFNRMSEELGNAFERERAMEQGRRDLIAAISHDLRTPLASMRVMLEAIGDGVVEDEETVTRYHRRMGDEIKHLSHLIDDLFELSRLDAGEAGLEPAPVDLAELVTETAESLEPNARQQGVSLEIAPLGARLTAWADPVQVQRVLVNLLENAIRYTGPGGSVCVAAQPQGDRIGVSISDSGEGIAGEDMPHVFDRFYRGEKSRARHSGGTGLGLAISKAIVEAHGGAISAESAPGQGARFTFTLPAAQ